VVGAQNIQVFRANRTASAHADGLTDTYNHAPMLAYWHDRFRAAMAQPRRQAFVERAGETDGYLDGAGFQAAMDAVLDAVGGALKA
jgi:hypothetical protein